MINRQRFYLGQKTPIFLPESSQIKRELSFRYYKKSKMMKMIMNKMKNVNINLSTVVFNAVTELIKIRNDN